MKRILITRPEPGASQTAQRISALGFVPVVAPILVIEPGKVCAHRLSQISATVITSRNAVPGCLDISRSLRVFAVGSATAKSATSHGFRHVIDADGDAMVLAGVVARALSPADGSILLPSGGGQGLELAKTLRSKGFRVVRRVAYRAVSVPALPAEAVRELREGQLAKAMFFSAETARHFVRLILEQGLGSAVHDVEAVSISERPVVALRRLAWRRISVADKPNQEAMLALL